VASGIYTAQTSGQAPLIFQLATKTLPSDPKTLLLFEINASGENISGSASFPVISRPAVSGVASSTLPVVSLNHSGAILSQAAPAVAFSSPPTLPPVSSGPFYLPIIFDIRLPEGSECIVQTSNVLLLYAAASGGHTWTAGMTWEEL